MIRSGRSPMHEKLGFIEFPNRAEAYAYADENNIDYTKIEQEDGIYYIPKQPARYFYKSSKDWKTKRASSRKDYSGKAYVLKYRDTGNTFYDGQGMNPNVDSALLYHHEEDARESQYYHTKKTVVCEVELKKGRVVKLKYLR